METEHVKSVTLEQSRNNFRAEDIRTTFREEDTTDHMDAYQSHWTHNVPRQPPYNFIQVALYKPPG
jgi:hypothetical protein